MARKAHSSWQMVRRKINLYATCHVPRASRGFTLVELLIVIGVIGLLASMFLGVYSQSQKRARDGQRKFDLNTVKSALEQYHSDRQAYPISANYNDLMTLLTSAAERDLKVAPRDPTLTPDYFYLPLNVDGQTTCTVAAQCQDYILCAKLENVNDSDITGVNARHPCKLQDKVTNPPGISGHNFGLRSP